MGTYDLFVKVPIVEDWLIEDRVRSIDRVFWSDIDKRVDELLISLKVGGQRLLRIGPPIAVQDILAEVAARLPQLKASTAGAT